MVTVSLEPFLSVLLRLGLLCIWGFELSSARPSQLLQVSLGRKFWLRFFLCLRLC